MNIVQKIASELSVRPTQVESVIALFETGATVPFIARYRKEATGGLDDTQLRDLEARFVYLTELVARKEVILASITEQGKLTDDLKAEIDAADNKARLEDLYLPYKPKRRTKAQMAIEAGIQPLADALLADVELDAVQLAAAYCNAEQGFADVPAVIEGARQILMERFSENAELVGDLRALVWTRAVISSDVEAGKEEEGKKFSDYFAFREAVNQIPSHRVLALFRGQNESILRLGIQFPDEAYTENCFEMIATAFSIPWSNLPLDHFLKKTVEWSWKIKLKLKMDLDCYSRLRESAEEQAIAVFKENLKNLLMSAPAGKHVTLALDPGFRTGVKTVVVDDTGKLLAHTVIYPHEPKRQWDASIHTLLQLCQQHHVSLVSIGNGTASRETDALVAALMKAHPDLALKKVIVSEAGASVYSASALAASEFPDLDVSYRGAVSIARRLQDPLAELVKIDPKSIGVGQYQHDVNQSKLSQGLTHVMEDCVNAVGADLNTASVPLLRVISGLNERVAEQIVKYREANGRFRTRAELKKVPQLGEKTFQQAIGFLRIPGGDNPLDASAVHPEAYEVVERILSRASLSIGELMGNPAAITQWSANAAEFADDKFGLPTVKDIFQELLKPGRDPRPEFVTAKLTAGIESINDLHPDMVLEGTVTNVTHFGAFVDIGVHQDGLVHISQLCDRYVANPTEVVKVGQILTVKVLEVDLKRNRIQLTCRTSKAPASSPEQKTKQAAPVREKKQKQPDPPNAFAEKLKLAIKKS